MPVGHVVDLRFHNFSLEPHEDCSFDFVEVHDSAGTGAASLMGRYPPPPLPKSSSHGSAGETKGWQGRAAKGRVLGASRVAPLPV